MDTTPTQYLVLSDGVFSVWSRRATGRRSWARARLGEKPSAILAILLSSPQPVQRSVVWELLWPEAPEPKARNCLRQALFRIRREMGVDTVVEASGGLALAHPGVRSELDPGAATQRREVRALDGKRPSLRLVTEGDEDGVGIDEPWRRRVLAFLEDPAAQLAAELRASPVRAPQPPDPARPAPPPPAPRRPRGRARRPEAPRGAAARDRSAQGTLPSTSGKPPSAALAAASAPATPVPDYPPVPDGSRVLVLDLGPEPVESPREAACRVVQQLWALRGAMGVDPGHRETLMRCQSGARVTMEALWSAIEDLLAAIAEDGPVLIRVASPERWPRIVLRRLASALDRLRTSPLTLLGTGIQLPSAYDRPAPALDALPPPDAGRHAPRTARG